MPIGDGGGGGGGGRGVRIMLEKVADSGRKAVKMAEPYKPYGGQFFEFCSISFSTYQTCMKQLTYLPEKVPNSANFSASIIRICLGGGGGRLRGLFSITFDRMLRRDTGR